MDGSSNFDLVGTVIAGRFEIVQPIGRGAMGTVYKAKQLGLERFVALKILTDELDEEAHARFLRESEILASLSHPNIAAFFAYGIWQDRLPFFVMELLPGESLNKLLERSGKLDWQTTLSLGVQICRGLSSAHKAGIIHRDLSPRNIIVDRSNDHFIARIIDFGLASSALSREQNLTRTGFLVGTPHYISPEICIGKKPDARSDLYSLGCILYECLAGVVPFDADSVFGIAYRHANEPPKSLSTYCSLPGSVEDLVLRALDKDPANRYASADEFAEALNAALATPNEPARRHHRVPKVGGIVIASCALIGLLVLAAGLVRLPGQQLQSRPQMGQTTGNLGELYSLTLPQFERILLKKVNSGEWKTTVVANLEAYEQQYRSKHEPEADSAKRFGNMWLCIANHGQNQDRIPSADKALTYLKDWEAQLLTRGADPVHLMPVKRDQALAHMYKFLTLPPEKSIEDGRNYINFCISNGKAAEAHSVHLELAQRTTLAGRLTEAVEEQLSVMKYRDEPCPAAAAQVFLSLQNRLLPENPARAKLQIAFMDYASDPRFGEVLRASPEQVQKVRRALERIQVDAAKQNNQNIAKRAAELQRSLYH